MPCSSGALRAARGRGGQPGVSGGDRDGRRSASISPSRISRRRNTRNRRDASGVEPDVAAWCAYSARIFPTALASRVGASSRCPSYEGEFQLPRLDRVISGVDCRGHALAPSSSAAAGVARCSSPAQTIGASATASSWRRAGRPVCVGVQRRAAARPGRQRGRRCWPRIGCGADALVSLGGGSPIDAAKIAVYGLLTSGARETGTPAARRNADDALGGRVHGRSRALPIRRRA